MSRLQGAHAAVRPALKGRLLLAGPSGSGKTLGGLILATELAEDAPILGIDTEKESMLTYADDFTFEHLAWSPPYSPQELAETLLEAGQKYGVVLVDSLSHFWRSTGGTLDIAGGKFSGWKEARPAQESLIEALTGCAAHVIATVRSKVEYAQEQEPSGRHVVRKLGMAAIQDDTLEFEMNVAFELSMDHTATVSKSRTRVLPVGRSFRPERIKEVASTYREWLAGGDPLASAEEVAQLLDVLNGIADLEQRKLAKQMFVESYGKPDHLLASRYEDALIFATEQAKGRADPAEFDEEPPADDAPVAKPTGRRTRTASNEPERMPDEIAAAEAPF